MEKTEISETEVTDSMNDIIKIKRKIKLVAFLNRKWLKPVCWNNFPKNNDFFVNVKYITILLFFHSIVFPPFQS